MYVFRFMSKEEFTKYMNSETLVNETDHTIHSKTTSKGFCFMECESIYDVEFAFYFLSTIVSEDYVCIFKCNKKLLKQTYGIYSDPRGDGWFDTMTRIEYCCNTYNNKDFKLINYCEDVSWNVEEQKHIFNWQNKSLA